MDSQRAEEILQANEIIEVHYKGESVWIESVDKENGRVRVQMDGTPNEHQTVYADELKEMQ
jgi:H-type small acid-soluble spore protein